MLKPAPHFDVKEHLRTLHRQVLPLFFILLGITLVLWVVIRAGKEGAELPPADYVGARVGLMVPKNGAAFDPALAVLSPTELVLAPTAVVFEEGTNPARVFSAEEGEVTVSAVADGRVVYAGPLDGEQVVLLSHEREGRPVQTRYGGLSTIRVAVGTQVRRGQVVGVRSDGAAEVPGHRSYPGILASDGAGLVSGVPADWRGREADRIAGPPEGEALEAAPLKLESTGLPKAEAGQ